MENSTNIEPTSNFILIQILKKHWKELIATAIFAFLLYSVMITNELTNTYDGMWHGVYGYANSWELSIGRWFWLAIDRLRLGITTEPGISLLSLLCFTIGNIVAEEMLQIWRKLSKAIFLIFLIANTSVCIFLSYRYTVLPFSLSYLFSVLGAFSFVSMYRYNRSKIVYSILTVCCITLSLGLYQADIGCTLILLSFVLLKNLWQVQVESIKKHLIKMIHAIVLIGCACIVYAGIWKICLLLMHTQKSTYNGAGSVSVMSILSGLPRSIHTAYTSFLQYFMPGQWQNIYQKNYIFVLALAIFLIFIIIYTIINKTKWSNKILSLICIILLPLLANVCLLLAPESNGLSLQMTMPMALIIPGFFGLVDSIDKKELNVQIPKLISVIYFAFIIFIAFGNIMMVSTDQHVMLQSKNTSTALMDRIITDTSDELNNLNNIQVVFSGVPANNSLYQKDVFWNQSNNYSHYGDFWTSGNCITQSYFGFLRDCGINVNLLSDYQKYHQIIESQEVKKMPVYPEKGYVKVVNGYLVIKISQ